ncbi:MAG: acyl carrier protein [Chitinophagales bacterium]
MNSEQLIEKIELEFDDLPKNSLRTDSKFRDKLNWNSINAVVVTTMIEFEFGVFISPEEMKTAETIADLTALINHKISD